MNNLKGGRVAERVLALTLTALADGKYAGKEAQIISKMEGLFYYIDKDGNPVIIRKKSGNRKGNFCRF